MFSFHMILFLVLIMFSSQKHIPFFFCSIQLVHSHKYANMFPCAVEPRCGKGNLLLGQERWNTRRLIVSFINSAICICVSFWKLLASELKTHNLK